MLSAVIPTLNAAAELPATLAALQAAREAGLVGEIIVADGGSTDATLAIAAHAGCRVLRSPRGRGPQLVAGAAAATGDGLLFLHADTRLQVSWDVVAADFVAAPENGNRAAVFAFALDDDSPGARLLERIVDWRFRLLALPYGDQGLLMSAAFYRQIGGFRPLPLMEDVEIIRRIGRRRLVRLPVAALTSARRYRRDGYISRMARNFACISLYLLGVPPRCIVRLYG
jgi:rSAM/selenodomain-associated transferase 2